MKKLYTAFQLVLLAALLGVGIYSLADQDAAGSASEKREFVRPEFSVRALLDGTYIPALEQYYSDTLRRRARRRIARRRAEGQRPDRARGEAARAGSTCRTAVRLHICAV